MALILFEPAGPGTRRAIVLFGAGLVGSALIKRLHTAEAWRATRRPLDWREPAVRDLQLREIGDRIVESFRGSPSARATLVWSAGRAGFASGAAEVAAELGNFQAFLGLAVRCAGEFPDRIRVLHFSSAGGLFEGQRHVDARSEPRPRRPYGELKAEEERLVAAAGIRARIVRLSSVYGLARPGHRVGLVAAMVLHGLRREVTRISGSMSTLRDFVFADDVAAFAGRLLLTEDWPAETAAPLLLASGRPASIFEVQKVIEDLLGHKLYVAHAPNEAHREDITFARSALPPGWVPSDLRSSAGHVHRDALASGFGSGAR